MVKAKYWLVWTTRSQQHLKQAFHYISKDSPQMAEKVISAIATVVEKAVKNPEYYSPDKYKKITMAAIVHLKNTATVCRIVLMRTPSGY